MTASRTACIVGVGETEYTKWGKQDRTPFDLACSAILAAAADAGLSTEEIDGFASYSNDENEGIHLHAALGARVLRWTSMVWSGGGGGSCASVAMAKAAVEGGYAECVVAFRSLCQGQSRRFGQARTSRAHAGMIYPFGLFSAGQMLAMPMQRHMHLYGSTQQQLGEIALTCRENAHRNPRAVMGGRKLTMEEYLAARVIADPYRLFDCCLESDGACAVIVTTRERARDLAGKPVRVLAAAMGGPALWGAGSLGAMNQSIDDYMSTGARPVAEDLYGRAGVKPSDIDVAQFYENFTGMVLMGLEDYGFCARGEGGPFVERGSIRWPNGALPINTAGGNLSEAYIHGMNHIAEGVRQVRGTSTAPVSGAELCLVAGGPGISPTSALILAPA
jgi:acetyl-CoA acetyltransferase